jgi:hypothetical protein
MHDLPEPFFANHASSNGRAFVKLGGECDAATLDLAALYRCTRERLSAVTVRG